MHNYACFSPLYFCVFLVKRARQRSAVYGLPIPVDELANTIMVDDLANTVDDFANTDEGTFSKIWACLRSNVIERVH